VVPWICGSVEFGLELSPEAGRFAGCPVDIPVFCAMKPSLTQMEKTGLPVVKSLRGTQFP